MNKHCTHVRTQSFKIVRVISIDSAAGTVSVEFLCVAHWHDATLVNVNRSSIDWAHAFTPKLSVTNAVDVEQVLPANPSHLPSPRPPPPTQCYGRTLHRATPCAVGAAPGAHPR